MEETITYYTGKQSIRRFWTDAIIWGKMCDQYAHIQQGDTVLATGSVATRSWEDKNGNKQYSTEMSVNEMTVVESAGGLDGQNLAPPSNDPDDSDLPF